MAVEVFPYKLAVAAIFKDEAAYLGEWLDYHLAAGVEHFYLYNNGSTDNFAEVLAPYAGLVTVTDWQGKLMQNPAYDDAVANHRFECKYIAFIDLDEFIFPKTGASIFETVDEIFSRDETIAAVGINMQYFGSNGQVEADLSRGVLERFTRRAPDDWTFISDKGITSGNVYIKSIVNPRRVDYFFGPHYAVYFGDMKSVDSRGNEISRAGNLNIATDKIVLNHYYTKSRAEFAAKVSRNDAFFASNPRRMEMFARFDRNEVFDDGIISYRAARAKNFFIEPEAERVRRVQEVLTQILTQTSPFDAPPDFFTGKLETFLTCRALAEVFGTQIGSRSAEEFALVWIAQTLLRAKSITTAEVRQFTRALPEILARPSPITRKLNHLTQEVLIPRFCAAHKVSHDWRARMEMLQLQKFLRLIK